ncbi:MAG TPA: cation:proton antiporter [Clostridia bacterium]|nr:cation:proton antiporter [Clostridia bacterium]
MLLSLALIIIFGLILNKAFDKISLPGLLGMLILGIIIGPYGLDLISPEVLAVSADLRKIALIIILIRAGLGLNKDTLIKVGLPAIKMSFIPGLFEGVTILFVSSYLLGISKIEAGMLAFIVAAVSPAVVVPSMLVLIEEGKGKIKGIPTLVLAGASIDDVVAITLFSTFLGFYGGKNVNIGLKLLNIPVSIILGVLIGILTGLLLIHLFKRFHMRDTKKVLLLISGGIILTLIEDFVKTPINFASLIGVMTVGFIIMEKYGTLGRRLAKKFNGIWVFAELLLFVLVGAEVNIYVALEAGGTGLLIIFIGLIARSIGVMISLAGSNLNYKERLFCVVAYTPKATVQAAIGAVPLAYGVASGELILAIAVLAIIVTAPLGAFGIRFLGEKWLSSPEDMKTP